MFNVMKISQIAKKTTTLFMVHTHVIMARERANEYERTKFIRKALVPMQKIEKFIFL